MPFPVLTALMADSSAGRLSGRGLGDSDVLPSCWVTVQNVPTSIGYDTKEHSVFALLTHVSPLLEQPESIRPKIRPAA